MKSLRVALALILSLLAAPAFAQGFTLPDGSTLGGHVNASGVGPPVAIGCTLTANSVDTAGLCTTSATSGSITFQRGWTVPPFCIVSDADAVSATSMPVYTVSATAITLTTVITAHKLFYFCIGTRSSI